MRAREHRRRDFVQADRPEVFDQAVHGRKQALFACAPEHQAVGEIVDVLGGAREVDELEARGELGVRAEPSFHEVLDGLGLRDRPEILVYNKLDLLPVGEGASRADEAGAIAVSALKRTGLKQLLESAELALFDEGHDADLGLGKPAWAVGGEG